MMRNFINIDDLWKSARKRLPRFVFDCIDGAAEDEITLERNRKSFEKVTLRPRVLVDVSKRNTSTTILGEPVTLPVLLAPIGLTRLASRNGEMAIARAAGREGTIFVLSTASSYSIEEVSSVATKPLWFQLYPCRSREVNTMLVQRAQNAGYHALCLTVDVQTFGKRERDLRNDITLPPRITLKKTLEVLRHPQWLYDYVFGPQLTLKNFVDLKSTSGMSAKALLDYAQHEIDNPSTSWEDLAWLRDLWKGPLVVKGIMTVEAALKALDYGVDGIVVSNHGGRQLDSQPATITVLPQIVDAVGNRAEIFIDGGIRRGTDVIKAIALGARACLIGRPYIFGLAARGEAGVAQVLQIFRDEIDRTLALIGCRSLAEVDRSTVSLEC
ncbi:alpha-hydroxy acid oxidase [Chloroflexota bacterium]